VKERLYLGVVWRNEGIREHGSIEVEMSLRKAPLTERSSDILGLELAQCQTRATLSVSDGEVELSWLE
jgi:hypothetical protein